MRPQRGDYVRVLRVLGGIAVALCWVLMFAHASQDRMQWDLETYYYASRAQALGLDPYQLASLTAVAGHEVKLPFVYPLILCYVFQPLTWLPLHEAKWVWLLAKGMMLAGLLWLWRYRCGVRISGLLFHAVVILAFNCTLGWDLKTGNVGIPEQLLLWAAFAAYLRGRDVHFVSCLVPASSLKLTPIALLSALFVPTEQRRRGLLLSCVALAGWLVLVLLPFAANPHLLASFVKASTGVREPGHLANPCFMGLCADLSALVTWDPKILSTAVLFAYISYITIIITLSLSRLRRSLAGHSRLDWVVSIVLLYAMMVPRLKCYSYGLLIVPLLLCLQNTSKPWRYGFIALAMLFAAALLVDNIWLNSRYLPLLWYGAFAQLCFVWIMWLRHRRVLLLDANEISDKASPHVGPELPVS